MSIIEYSAERHINAVRNEAYDSGLEQGLEQGLGQGIAGTVVILRGMNLSDEGIIEKICGQYGLTEEQARKYL